jgi:hypothetical protein
MQDSSYLKKASMNHSGPRVRDLSIAKLIFGFAFVPALGTGRYLWESLYSSEGLRGSDYAIATGIWIVLSVLVFVGYRLGLKRKTTSGSNTN